MAPTIIPIVDIPVAIVGGGGCGLTISNILSDQHVDHVLFERHPSTSILPKASNLNQRTLEIWRQHGISDDIYKAGAPPRNMGMVFWQTSLGGNGLYDRRVIGKLPCYGGAEGMPLHEVYKRDSPALGTNLPLLRAEPILRSIAQARNPNKVLFGHNVTDLTVEDDTVLLTVQTPDKGIVQYRAKYVVGADGGKTIGPKVGVVQEGETQMEDKISVHFKADLSEYVDDRSLITHFLNPEGGNVTFGGVLIPMGPTWGRKSEEWAINFGHRLDDPERFNDNNLVPRLRALLKLPDLKVEILKISHWIQERVLANKYREGRVFVAGDAAHRHPPTSGLGLNSGIGDAHNLAWKLAMVVKGQAHPSILDTYETERRPVAARNCDWSVLANMNRQCLSAAIGLVPGQVEANRARFDRLFESSESGRTARAHVTRIIQTQDIEFSSHDVELGPRYAVDPRLHDSSDQPPLDPLGQIYRPTTIPGHRLPHAWLLKESKKISTHDLVGPDGSFCLITDGSGQDWVRQAERISADSKSVKIKTAQIKNDRFLDDAEIEDWDDSWNALRQIDDGGAILVRPDNYVGWRSKGKSRRGGAELAEAFSILLGTSGGQGVVLNKSYWH